MVPFDMLLMTTLSRPRPRRGEPAHQRVRERSSLWELEGAAEVDVVAKELLMTTLSRPRRGEPAHQRVRERSSLWELEGAAEVDVIAKELLMTTLSRPRPRR